MTRTTVAVLAAIALASAAPDAQDPERLFKAAMNTELVDGDLRSAIEQYRKVADAAPRPLAAQALLRMAESYQKLGDLEARAVYERIVREFGDQPDTAAAARTRLSAMRPAVSEPMVQTTRRIWAGPEVGGGGTPSMDGRYLSFQVGETGDLAIRDLTTDTTRRLTDTGGWAASGDYSARSVISPDGRLVAYHWFIEQANSQELRLISTSDPTRPRVLFKVPSPEYIEPFGVTPDGQQVVVGRTLADRTRQLGVVAASNRSYRSIKSLDWRYPRGVSLSPDGRYLAYDIPAGDAGSPRDIFVLATDGSRETAAVSGAGDDSQPLWTADGSRLVFLSTRGGSPSLWSVGVENGRVSGPPVLVKANTGSIVPLGITRAGALYYGVVGGTRQNIYSAPLEGLKVTGTPSLITEQFVDFSTGPTWSPDGQSLAFFSTRSRPILVVRTLMTGAERTVALPQGVRIPFQAGPRWFPDGRSVLVLADDPQGSGRAFYRVNIETSASERLHRMNEGPSSFALAPDGRSIFWCVQNTTGELNGSGVLMRYDIAEARETTLKRGEWFIALAVSPDGTQLAYLKSVRTDDDRRKKEYPSVVEVISVSGGPARPVFRDAIWLNGARYNTLAWTPDGRHLMFVRDDGLLWRVPIGGGDPEEMGIAIKGRIKNPSIHPSGKQIVFSVGRSDDNEVWALENFLPRVN